MVAHRRARVQPRARRDADADVVVAQRDVAIAQLRTVLGLVDRRAYMAPEHQRVLNAADALISESERW